MSDPTHAPDEPLAGELERTTEKADDWGLTLAADLAHRTVVSKAVIPADLARVYQALEDVAERTRWMPAEGEEVGYLEADFRVGGRDVYRGGPPGAPVFTGWIVYLLIDPGRHVVWHEVIDADGDPVSASLVTWVFQPHTAGTVVTVTTQVTSFAGETVVQAIDEGNVVALANLASYLVDGGAAAGR